MKSTRLPVAAALITLAFGAGELKAEPSAKELIDLAESKRKEAAEIGYEWRDTAKHIKSAEAALESGKEEEARALARLALLEGKQAVAQGTYMREHWTELIPKP